MLCQIYRSARTPDTYLYLPVDAEFEALPDALKQRFGVPEKVMELEIKKKMKLARSTPSDILRSIDEQGYYLQLPPNLYENKHNPWG